MGRAEESTIRVAVACSPREGEASEVAAELPAASTVADAIRASGVVDLQLGGAFPADEAIGVWGKAATVDTPLVDGDRVELYRPLAVDPKEARRLRATAGKRVARGARRRRRADITCSRRRSRHPFA